MVTHFAIRPRKAVRAALLALFALTVSGTVDAQTRARLSRDLADRVATGASHIEVIIDDAGKANRLAARYNLQIKRRLRTGAVLEANAGQLAALQSDGEVDHLSGNVRYHSSALAVDPVDEGIGVDQVWAGVGSLPRLTGRGVTVAVIDSGIDPNHHALKGQVVATVDFTGGNGADGFGHGTHVAAIIAGRSGRSSATRMFRGVAPGASLINLRVLGNDGSGSAADVIDAIDWAVDHRLDYNIRVINLSLGAPVTQSYHDDPVCAAVERAVRAGLVVVAAAGNHGTNANGQEMAGGITSPGNSPFALTVGALDAKGTADRSDDDVAAFSSNGPTAFDHILKPDLVAPGRRVTSAEAAGSLLSVDFPLQHVAGQGGDAYIYGSGTSMAAAFVSGAAALLLEERPGLRPLGVKASLELTSSFLPSAGLVRSGAGSLNVVAAAEFVKSGRLSEANVLLLTTSDTDYNLENSLLRSTDRGKASSTSGASDSVIWGTSDSVIWGTSDSVIWGTSDSVIWGTSDSVIWGTSDSVIWGTSDSVIWGTSESHTWANAAAQTWSS